RIFKSCLTFKEPFSGAYLHKLFLLALFNFQGTFPPPPLGGSFVIVPQRERHVNNFFDFFQSFFRRRTTAPPLWCLDNISLLRGLCQQVFGEFLKLFCNF
ncbi:MAG: hypothetical protein IKO83_08785, partial [Oscillospiraceae bacterium]|nr:hypothetical protein [Oscillospiraceae bacterium]